MKWGAVLFLLVGLSISAGLGIPIGNSVPGGAVDLQVLYYPAKCVLLHCDPYKPVELRRLFAEEARKLPTDSIEDSRLVAPNNYLPSAFLLAAPLVFLPWTIASLVWLALLAGTLFLASLLIFQDGATWAPRLSLLLAFVIIANAEVGIALANAALVVVSLCTIAACLLIRQKYVFVAQVALTAALALKPHDAIFILVYFLVASGRERKRGLTVVGFVVVLMTLSIAWIQQVSPHWLREWKANVANLTARGHLNDPGPLGEKSHNAGQVIDLQAALSIVKDDPGFYDPIAYGGCGLMLLLWAGTTLRARYTEESAWLALAAVAPLSLLITYHRSYDAKLLLLAIPSCAALWRSGGRRAWSAVVLTTAAVMLTSDLPLMVVSKLGSRIDLRKMGVLERICVLPVVRPATLSLLAMAGFYLWVYVRSVWAGRERRATMKGLPTA